MARTLSPDLRKRVIAAVDGGLSRHAAGERFGVAIATAVRCWQSLTFKKTTHASEQDRPDVAARRRAWFDAQPDLDPECLVFIDETGASTKMARLQGRAPRGER